MAGDIVVWIIVGLVAVLIGRRFYRVFTDIARGCGCAGGACSQAKAYHQTGAANVESGRTPEPGDATGPSAACEDV